MPDSSNAASLNKLADETSPYLLQHQDNPVDWHPWSEEALAKAQAENKPILLSVGYAACHWCHVMAHESFEDAEVAKVMNAHFLNIKVDREERPDLDQIYQQALALLGQHGGWPLTMFLTPKGEPFWGGTYFPKEDMYGRPGFPRVLEAISQVYHQEPEKVAKNVASIHDALQQLSKPVPGHDLPPNIGKQVAQRLAQEIDPKNGGIGGAPKFPQPAIMKLLWRESLRSGDDSYRESVELTLRQMSQGGIYDHLGGGYARYTVDERWLVPHFEKMLYDNAQILDLLTWAWQDTGKPLYRQRAEETVGWLLREMIALDAEGNSVGGFAATLDADSEGEEGKFYVWSEAEIDAILGADAALFKQVYDVKPGGNWEDKTILNRLDNPELADEETEAKLAECRKRLVDERAKRVWPGWDDKVLADWNGLMISALAEAGAVFDRPEWSAAAERAFAFVRETMPTGAPGGRLHHSWRRGVPKHAGTLDDHAAMAQAALTLFEHTGRRDYLRQAEAWAEVVERHFRDPVDGGYFITADDVADVIVRPKNAHDNAQPSGNAVMLGVLARLFHLTGDKTYGERGESTIRAFAAELERNFVPLCTLILQAEVLRAGVQVVLVGNRDAEDTQALLRAVLDTCQPTRILHPVTPQDSLPEGHPAAGKSQQDGGATAYVCHGFTCSLPITEPEALKDALRG